MLTQPKRGRVGEGDRRRDDAARVAHGEAAAEPEHERPVGGDLVPAGLRGERERRVEVVVAEDVDRRVARIR